MLGRWVDGMAGAECGAAEGRQTDMTGPGPSDPGAQEPTPPAPEPTQPAGGGWGQQPAAGGGTPSGSAPGGPDWAQQAQQWRPAEVAGGPAAGIAYADLGIRIGAYIVDLVILVVIGIVVNIILGAILFASLFAVGTGAFIIGALILLIINVAIGAVYFIYTWTTMKASPGQRILGLMTVNDSDGSALTTNAAISRYLVMFAPGYVAALASNVIGGTVGLLLSLVGLGWTIYLLYTTANDPKRQGFHDKYAHSVVVKPG
jgi:uncharacterized RDD family membrane protein YckC